MRYQVVTTLRRHCTMVAACVATLCISVPLHAQATAQPAKPAAATKPAATKPATPKPAAVAAPAGSPAMAPTPAKAAAPAQQPPAVAKPAASPLAPQKVPAASRVYIDINHATLTELKQIPGIGDVYGKKIIAGRPYANKTQLVSRKIIDAGLYETIQGMIIAKQ